MAKKNVLAGWNSAFKMASILLSESAYRETFVIYFDYINGSSIHTGKRLVKGRDKLGELF